ncbi:MAG: N-acetylneuraminate synthase family protein [Dehalococcoidales bacterium]|nr:N-acetylneuraminate synthase family protein [Dehalococcoidales bacterium]
MTEQIARTSMPIEMKVGSHVIGNGHPTFFMVEEGQANEGNYELAIRMIGLTAQTGANAIEFQFAIADDLYVRTHPAHAVYKSREFSREQLVSLRMIAEEYHLLIVGSPLSDNLVTQLVEAGYPLLDINSSDLVNPRMLDAIAETGVPFMVGTAMSSIDDIDWAVDRLLHRKCGSFCLLHGQHVMATGSGRGVPEKQVSLSTVNYLRDRYHLPVGFTDHTSSEIVPALAVANGAAVITKHLAPQLGWRGPDWEVCLAPDAMERCVQLVRLADVVKGTSERVLASGELADRSQMRRSIVAQCDLSEGTCLEAKHLLFKRSGVGLDPRQEDSIVGKRLIAAIKKDEIITLDKLS